MRHSITHNVANSATKLQIKCRIAKENPKITHILRRYLQQTAKKCLLYSIFYYLFLKYNLQETRAITIITIITVKMDTLDVHPFQTAKNIFVK